jgi:2-phospho-L-lactate/phosphoenolpyruvate guanylyltransferase
MRVLAVPVKPLEQAKRRLASVLTPAERAALTLVMMEDVLDACMAQPGWEVWVVSQSEAALEVAARRGARPVSEHGASLLAAIRQIEPMVRGRWSPLAVLLADLPFLTAAALAAALARPGRVVAAPAESDGGTNLLIRRPPSAIAARFGRSSFRKHRAEAYRGGLTFEEHRAPELGFDLDRPTDLLRVLASPGTGRTRLACLEMRLPERLGVAV